MAAKRMKVVYKYKQISNLLDLAIISMSNSVV